MIKQYISGQWVIWGKNTILNNKLKKAWNKFYKDQYHGGREERKYKNLILFAVDSGGYDITNEVTLEMINDKLILTFRKWIKGNKYKWHQRIIKQFTLEVKDG